MAQASLYKTKTRKSKKKILLTPQEEQAQYNNKQVPSLDQECLAELGFLSQQFNQLDSARPDDKWELRYRQYIAAISYRQDGLANVNLAIEQATIRNKIADFFTMKPVITLIPTEKSDIYKREMMRTILDFVNVEANTDYELIDAVYQAFTFGTAVWYEGLFVENKTLYEPEVKENGEIVGKEVKITRSWLGGKALDIRDVWVDTVAKIEDAEVCYIREKDLSFSDIEGLLDDPNYDKDQVTAFLQTITPDSWGQNLNRQLFATKEEMFGGGQGKVAVMHYYNQAKGVYMVTDESFRFLLRKGPLPFAHGELPISIMVDHPRPLELYGIGECELLENTKYERNLVRNQMLDMARESNTINFAVGENVAFEDSEQISGVMRIWNFTGNLGNAQYMKPPSQDGSLSNMDALLRDDATWITGIDNNSLVGSPTRTAFEARLQEQNKLKGVAVTMKHFDRFLSRIMRQRLKNIQFFLPTTTGRQILGDSTLNKYRTIALVDMEKEPIRGVNMKTFEAEDRGFKLNPKQGEIEFLEMKPSLLKNNLDVQVATPMTTPILRELDKAESDEFVTSMLPLIQTPQGQELFARFDLVEWYRDKMISKGLDPDKYIKDPENANEKQKLRAELLAEMPLPIKPSMQPNIAGRGGQDKPLQAPPKVNMPFLPNM